MVDTVSEFLICSVHFVCTELHEVDTTSVKKKHLIVINKILLKSVRSNLLTVHILKIEFYLKTFPIFRTLLEIDPTCVGINRNLPFKSRSLQTFHSLVNSQNVVVESFQHQLVISRLVIGHMFVCEHFPASG